VKSVRILYNQNKLCSEVSSDAIYKNEHSEFSIRLVFSGHEQYNIGNRDLNIYPGNFLVINQDTIYDRKIYSYIPSNTFSVFFAPGFLSSFHSSVANSEAELLTDPFSAAKANPSFLETIYPFKGHLMCNMLHLKEYFDNGDINDLLADDYLYHTLLLFYQLYNQEILAKSKQLDISNSRIRTEIFKRLSVAKDYMLSNYHQQVTLEDISNIACLSAPHLFRTFRQTFQCSPHQYLVKIRLDNARHLLKTTKYSLNEIVNLVGFTCASTFIKLFKKRYGHTPQNYRAKNPVALYGEMRQTA
jgi:AraC family transcriptional regulator